MIVKIEKRDNPYVQMDVRFLNDDRLTAKAKGILAYLLSKPANWEVRIKDLENKFSDGACALRSGIKELESFGYISIKLGVISITMQENE